MIVRKMLPQEFDSTITLFGYYRDEAILAMPIIEEQYDENSVIDTIKQHASHWEYCWFNAYDGQRPVGFIAGYLSSCPWNKAIVTANISFIYLLESHRNMDNFKQLMKHFTEWALLVEASEITGGDIGINPDRMRTLYEYFGFKPLLLMSKDINNV